MKRMWRLALFFFVFQVFALSADNDDLSENVQFLAEQFQQDGPDFSRDTKGMLPEDNVQAEALADNSFDHMEYSKPGRHTKPQQRHYVGNNVVTAVQEAAGDILNLHKNLFTWDSFKVICSVFPLFVGARMIDEKLQRCFYDSKKHKNLNQPPSWCHEVAKASIAVPIVLFGTDVIFSKDPDKKWTGQIFLLGMPFVIWTKKIVKQMKFDACLRPWHEKFSCENRSYGGFPSGHMAQALYAAVLYGSRYGPKYAVPLGGIAAFIGVTFLACNRHYLSQLIAGSAFGTLYALAASKVVEKKMTDKIKLGIAVDPAGHPTFSASVKW